PAEPVEPGDEVTDPGVEALGLGGTDPLAEQRAGAVQAEQRSLGGGGDDDVGGGQCAVGGGQRVPVDLGVLRDAGEPADQPGAAVVGGGGPEPDDDAAGAHLARGEEQLGQSDAAAVLGVAQLLTGRGELLPEDLSEIG